VRRRAGIASGTSTAHHTLTGSPFGLTTMTSSLVSDILFGFTGLISIINPFAIAFVFLDRTESLTVEERATLAKRVSINAFFVLIVVFFVGTPVLHFFGISIEALRIGGGLAVAVSAWNMLNAPETRAEAAAGKPVDPDNAMSKAFFPLTMPLTTGPGTIATAIALNANRTHKLSEFVQSSIASIVISILVVLVVYFTYSRSAYIAHFLGKEGTRVALRVSAFLLLCIGVQIMLTGFSEFLAPLAANRPAS
jgi:multiple antibiotic resistance protein